MSQIDSYEAIDLKYAWTIARAYGFDGAGTLSEVKAYAQVLARMGAFAAHECVALGRVGWLG